MLFPANTKNSFFANGDKTTSNYLSLDPVKQRTWIFLIRE